MDLAGFESVIKMNLIVTELSYISLGRTKDVRPSGLLES